MCLGIPGRILAMRNDFGLAVGVVDFGGVQREACLAYVEDEVEVGDYVIVHVGFAISKVDEKEARRTFAALLELGGLEELDGLQRMAEQSLTAMDGIGEARVPAPPAASTPASRTAGRASDDAV